MTSVKTQATFSLQKAESLFTLTQLLVSMPSYRKRHGLDITAFTMRATLTPQSYYALENLST